MSGNRYTYITLYGHRKANMCLRACSKCTDSVSSHACAMSHPVTCSPLIHLKLSNGSVSRLRRNWSDCAYAQADLDRRCPLMREETFAHSKAHVARILHHEYGRWLDIHTKCKKKRVIQEGHIKCKKKNSYPGSPQLRNTAIPRLRRKKRWGYNNGNTHRNNCRTQHTLREDLQQNKRLGTSAEPTTGSLEYRKEAMIRNRYNCLTPSVPRHQRERETQFK